LFGEPVEITAELDDNGLETARCLLETRMVEMVGEADRRMGHQVSPILLSSDIGQPGGRFAGG